MKRSAPAALIALGLFGVVIGFLIEVTAASSGTAIVVPPVTMAPSLAVIGIVVALLAWPIHQATTGTARRRVDPFRALRVALLAKASSFSGALFLGGGLGLITYLLTRSVQPTTTSLWLAIGMAIGAAVLLSGGLVAEYFCTLPPDEPEEERQDAPGGVHA